MEYENIYFHQSFTTSICKKLEKGLKTRGRLFIYYFRTHRSSDHIVVKIHFCPSIVLLFIRIHKKLGNFDTMSNVIVTSRPHKIFSVSSQLCLVAKAVFQVTADAALSYRVYNSSRGNRIHEGSFTACCIKEEKNIIKRNFYIITEREKLSFKGLLAEIDQRIFAKIVTYFINFFIYLCFG